MPVNRTSTDLFRLNLSLMDWIRFKAEPGVAEGPGNDALHVAEFLLRRGIAARF